MNPKLSRQLWILGGLLLLLDVVLLFSFESGFLSYVLMFISGLVPLFLGVWFTVSWLSARDRGQ